MRFTGKVVMVTGSTKGIGAQVARRFAAEGASVIVTGRSKDLGEGVVAQIRQGGALPSSSPATSAWKQTSQRSFEPPWSTSAACTCW